MGKDAITNKPITKEEAHAANIGKKFFEFVEELKVNKDLKDDKIQKIPVK